MSLDISLVDSKVSDVECACLKCCNVHYRQETIVFYEANITHNLTEMADAAGIYKCIWRPEELGITEASQLVAPLREGLKTLGDDPEKFRAFNPSNGWGSYEVFVAWVTRYLMACQEFPGAVIEVSR